MALLDVLFLFLEYPLVAVLRNVPILIYLEHLPTIVLEDVPPLFVFEHPLVEVMKDVPIAKLPHLLNCQVWREVLLPLHPIAPLPCALNAPIS